MTTFLSKFIYQSSFRFTHQLCALCCKKRAQEKFSEKKGNRINRMVVAWILFTSFIGIYQFRSLPQVTTLLSLSLAAQSNSRSIGILVEFAIRKRAGGALSVQSDPLLPADVK